MFDAIPAPSWTSGVDGHGTVFAFSWLPWPLDEIKSRRDGPRTGNRHFILKKVKFYSRSRKKVTVLNLFYKGAVNAYFLTGSFFKKTVVFEAAIFVGQSEDGAEVRCEVSRRVEKAVSRYSGPSGLRATILDDVRCKHLPQTTPSWRTWRRKPCRTLSSSSAT